MPAEVVEFGDIEASLVSYLKLFLSARGITARVSTRRRTGDDTLVRVTRTGGVRANLVTDRPIVTFECWDPDEVKASLLAQVTRAAVQALAGDQLVSGLYVSWQSEVGGPAYFPHPETDTPRYQHTQELAVVGQTVQ